MLARVLAVVAGLEGLALLGYAVVDIVAVVGEGFTGPEEVSNPAAFVMQVVIFTALGVGLVVVARGWWTRRRWVRGPFVLAQLLGLVVGVPLLQSTAPLVGVAIVAITLVSLVVSLLPAVTRAIVGDQAAM
jgi:hypothetical protein